MFTLLFMVVLAPFSSGIAAVLEDENTYVQFYIVDAYYTDAEGDGLENDVISDFFMRIITAYSSIHLLISIYLELPSTTSYTYDYTFRLGTGDYDLRMYFYNHATESGWYIVTITVTVMSKFQLMSGYESLVFDPPGQHEGTEPLIGQLVFL